MNIIQVVESEETEEMSKNQTVMSDITRHTTNKRNITPTKAQEKNQIIKRKNLITPVRLNTSKERREGQVELESLGKTTKGRAEEKNNQKKISTDKEGERKENNVWRKITEENEGDKSTVMSKITKKRMKRSKTIKQLKVQQKKKTKKVKKRERTTGKRRKRENSEKGDYDETIMSQIMDTKNKDQE